MVPAVYTWTGMVDSDSTNMSNWMVLQEMNPDDPPPPPPGLPDGDDTLIFGSVAAVDPVTGYSRDCAGLMSATDSFAGVWIESGYTGTVSLGAALTFGIFSLADGAISQPSSGTDLTVTDDFTWTGGTLNSSTYASTVHLSGATATIDPGETNTIISGSTLNLVNSASLTVQPGTIQFGNGVELVLENSTMLINAQKTDGTAANVKLEGLDGTFTTDKRIMTLKTGSTLTVTGPGTWTNDKMALEIAGGTVDVQNKATGQITRPNANVPDPILLSSGTLRLHTGSTIVTSDGRPRMSGGNLVIVGDEAGPAKFDGGFGFKMTGGNISFTGNKAIFEVTGDVIWTGGVFKPRVDVTANGISDMWYIKHNLEIQPPAEGQPITATIAPVSENYVPSQGVNSSFRWTVIRIDGIPVNAPQITTDGPNYMRYTGSPGGNTIDWMLGVP